MLDLQNNIKSSQVCGPQPCELCFFPPGINRKSPARRPGGLQIRRTPNGIICAYFLFFGALLNLYIKCTMA